MSLYTQYFLIGTLYTSDGNILWAHIVWTILIVQWMSRPVIIVAYGLWWLGKLYGLWFILWWAKVIRTKKLCWYISPRVIFSYPHHVEFLVVPFNSRLHFKYTIKQCIKNNHTLQTNLFNHMTVYSSPGKEKKKVHIPHQGLEMRHLIKCY